jgi:hypothetical protein
LQKFLKRRGNKKHFNEKPVEDESIPSIFAFAPSTTPADRARAAFPSTSGSFEDRRAIKRSTPSMFKNSTRDSSEKELFNDSTILKISRLF